MDTEPLSLNHKRRLRKLRLKKYREREGLFLAEGRNACREALRGDRYPLREIIISRDLPDNDREWLSRELSSRTVPVYSCSRADINELSSEEHARGILVVCKSVDSSLDTPNNDQPDRIVYLEGISDAGNLGTIMRTSLWFGVNRIALGPSCIDPYNTKVIRASAGTIFGVSLIRDVAAEKLFSFAETQGYDLVATSPRGGIPPAELKKEGRIVLLLGEESRGLSSELMEHAHTLVTVPGSGAAESLNLAAAAAILLYETRTVP